MLVFNDDNSKQEIIYRYHDNTNQIFQIIKREILSKSISTCTIGKANMNEKQTAKITAFGRIPPIRI